MASKQVQRRKKVGIAGAPIDGEFEQFKIYFHYDVDGKDLLDVTKNYIKKYWVKEEANAILANPNWEYSHSHIAAMCYWIELDNTFPGDYVRAKEFLTDKFNNLINKGKELLKTKAKEASTVSIVTPAMRMKAHVLTTVMEDLYLLEDQWLSGDKPKAFNLYNQMQVHDIKRFVEIESWISEFTTDYRAFLNKDEEILEAYPHLTVKEVTARMKILESFEADVESFKASKKAVRKIKVTKVKGADKQVSKLKYNKSDSAFKLTSINPLRLPSSMHVYLFNTKTQQLTVLNSMSPYGVTVSGSTVKGFDKETSIVLKLRKPNDLIPIILKKSTKQIAKALEALTTKTKVPTGRINEHMVILQCK